MDRIEANAFTTINEVEQADQKLTNALENKKAAMKVTRIKIIVAAGLLLELKLY